MTDHIKPTKPEEGAIVGTCAHCGRTLRRKQAGGRLPTYCSRSCRVRAWRARRKAGQAAAVAILALVLTLTLTTAVRAQDGNQTNNSDQTTNQPIEVNNVNNCEPGAVCTINNSVTVPEVEAPLQANSSAPAAAPVEPVAADPCGPGMEWDPFFVECYDPSAEPLGDLSWDAVLGIAGGAFVICVGLVLALLTRPKGW